jgi:bifunctional DNA-binding transcriptional regulator/antitoxin component of YhaV-PrlF toxin-antitoxin module
MPLTRIWSKGQVTIPAQYRAMLHLEENMMLNTALIGETIVLSPHHIQGEKLAKKFEKEMKKKDLSLNDLLTDLRAIRHDHTKEKYGT